MSDKQFRFDLEIPVKYMDTPTAMNSEADHLIFLAPSYKHYKNGRVNDIKKYIKSAQNVEKSLVIPMMLSKSKEELDEFQNKAKNIIETSKDEKKKQNWDDVINLLQADTKNFDNNFFKLLVDLFCDGCCLINGTTKLNNIIWDAICETDGILYEKICGEFVANFLNY
jgi:hypothetical protein